MYLKENPKMKNKIKNLHLSTCRLQGLCLEPSFLHDPGKSSVTEIMTTLGLRSGLISHDEEYRLHEPFLNIELVFVVVVVVFLKSISSLM